MKKLTERERFEYAVVIVIKKGKYPSPALLNKHLHPRRGQSDSLSGRECRWRREVCEIMGFKLRGKNA